MFINSDSNKRNRPDFRPFAWGSELPQLAIVARLRMHVSASLVPLAGETRRTVQVASGPSDTAGACPLVGSCGDVADRTLKAAPLAIASEVPVCKLGLACTTWAVQKESARSSSHAIGVVFFAEDSLRDDGIQDHHRKDTRVANGLPRWLPAHLDFAKSDPQSSLGSCNVMPTLVVPTECKELFVHNCGSGRL